MKYLLNSTFSSSKTFSIKNFLGGITMKKFATLGIIFLFTLTLTGCGEKYSYEHTEFKTIVIDCEEGTYHPDASYMAIANMYLAQNNLGMWSTYMNLSYTQGAYDYDVTVSINGNNYTVIREQKYEIGEYITITMVNTYNQDTKQLVKRECK